MAELTLVVGYIPRWFTCPQTVTQPDSKHTQRRADLLIETNLLTTSTDLCLLNTEILGEQLLTSELGSIQIFPASPSSSRRYACVTFQLLFAASLTFAVFLDVYNKLLPWRTEIVAKQLALEVIFNVMRSINPRFSYLLTYKTSVSRL